MKISHLLSLDRGWVQTKGLELLNSFFSGGNLSSSQLQSIWFHVLGLDSSRIKRCDCPSVIVNAQSLMLRSIDNSFMVLGFVWEAQLVVACCVFGKKSPASLYGSVEDWSLLPRHKLCEPLGDVQVLNPMQVVRFMTVPDIGGCMGVLLRRMHLTFMDRRVLESLRLRWSCSTPPSRTEQPSKVPGSSKAMAALVSRMGSIDASRNSHIP